ncbi:nuclease A inhibitor family protein [Hymenobacter defluvii]|uniref:HIT domain-containing protein n=1 Tax=Hymenobacter defluvii TaxID=2054411 RepID=A0ABS3T6U0_9BACT|nr:HIT domain-containing protein [Hymenobacter defluvii]
MPSIFSRIVAGELPAYKVAEDDAHLAFLDITPLVEGHTLVIPKKETDYIFDLPPQELAALNLFAQRVAKGVRAAVPCKRIGVAVIGLEVPHAHIHLIPMNHVADMNFANPKIKVPEERMQELAAAIAAQVPATDTDGVGSADTPPLESKAERETVGSNVAAAAPASDNDGPFAQLRQLTQGLRYVAETEAPLEAVRYPAPQAELTPETVRELVGAPSEEPVQTQELTVFLRQQTADNGPQGSVEAANRFKALQMFLKQELDDTQVYRIGEGPQIPVYVLGKTANGQLMGFKTQLSET